MDTRAVPVEADHEPVVAGVIRKLIPLLVVVLGVACASAPSLVPPAAVPAASSHGQVSFEILANAEVSRRQDPQREWRPAMPEADLDLPPLPPHLLGSGFSRGSVAARITISTAGEVVAVEPSPLAASDPGGAGEALWSAVEETVRGWRFAPAEVRRLEDGPDQDGDGTPDYRAVIDSHPVPVYLDVRFAFAVVGGRGEVRLGGDLGDG